MMKILRGIDSALLKIQNLILVFSTAIIILFMCTGVVMRYFFHANFHGLEELLLIMGFWIYFFGGSVAFHDEDHMEASILQPRLKTQKSKDIYLIARNVLSLPTLVIVCKWSYDYVVWSIDLLPTTVTYNIPYAVAQVPILICFVLAVFYTIANVVKAAAALKNYHSDDSQEMKEE